MNERNRLEQRRGGGDHQDPDVGKGKQYDIHGGSRQFQDMDRVNQMNTIPKVGFVSLGCPKASVDSEHILTELRAEGYLIAPNYSDADLVVVNTCGFIDAAVEESLDAIGEALAENGKVIVTGCLGAKGDVVRQAHPQRAGGDRPARHRSGDGRRCTRICPSRTIPISTWCRRRAYA